MQASSALNFALVQRATGKEKESDSERETTNSPLYTKSLNYFKLDFMIAVMAPPVHRKDFININLNEHPQRVISMAFYSYFEVSILH